MDKESTKWIRFLGGKNLLYTLTIQIGRAHV